MEHKLFYSSLLVLFILSIIGLMFFVPTENNTFINQAGTIIKGMLGDELQYTIDGDKVYFEDSRVYTDQTPHTLTYDGESVVWSLISKVYEGDVKYCVGQDTTKFRFENPKYYSPHNVTKSFTCSGYFNYTLSPNHFWCYNNVTTYTDETNTTLLDSELVLKFDHDFETGDIQQKTAYWKELEEWKELKQEFEVINYAHGGMDKWYCLDFNVIEDKEYKLKADVRFKKKGFSYEKVDTKFWTVFYPATESISEAISNNHFYALDPFIDNSNNTLTQLSYLDDYVVAYYSFDNGHELEDVKYGRHNLSLTDGSGQTGGNSSNYKLGQSLTCGEGVIYNITGRVAGDIFNLGSDGAIVYWYREWVQDDRYTQSIVFNEANNPLISLYTTGSALSRTSISYNTVLTTPNNVDVISAATWYMFTANWNSSNSDFWINNARYGTGTTSITASFSGASTMNICSIAGDNANFQGNLDEFMILNKSLNSSEIAVIYNSGNAITYDKSLNVAPIVSLDSPANNTEFAINSVEFNCSATDDQALINLSLIVDNNIEYTITNSSSENVSMSLSYEVTGFSYGLHNWTCKATDFEFLTDTGAEQFVNVTAQAPTVTLNSPPVNLETTNTTITLNCSAVDPNSNIINLSLYVNSVLYQTVLNTTTDQQNLSLQNTTSYVEGDYNWTCKSSDSIDLQGSVALRNFEVDLTKPFVNQTGLLDVVTYTLPTTIDWGINATDTGVGVDSCYYNYTDNVTYTIITCNTDTTTTLASGGNKTFYYCANDTVGNTNCSATTITVTSIIANQTATPIVTAEGQQVTFKLVIDMDSIPSTSTAKLYYNGTLYATDITKTTVTNNINYSKTLIIPSGHGNLTGERQEWYWKYTVTGYAEQTMPKDNITIYSLGIDNCSSYGYVLLNWSLLDIVDQTFIDTSNASITSTVELDINITSAVSNFVSFEFSKIWSDENNGSVCINENVLNYSDFSFNAIFSFIATDYAQNFYNILDETINNESYYDLDLFLLNDSLATLTVLQVNDEAQQKLGNVIIEVFYKDIGTGTDYLYAVAKTSSLGADLVYLNWYDSLYRFDGYRDGELIFSTNAYKIYETPQIFQYIPGSVFDFQKFEDFDYSLTFNNVTKVFTLSYTKPSELVSAACLRVIKRNITADYKLCEECDSSTTSTITCDVSAYGNGTFIAGFYATGSMKWIDILAEAIGVQEKLYDLIGDIDGTLFAIIMSGVVLSFFLFSPMLAVIGLLIGMTISYTLGFQPIDVSAFAGLVIIGGFVIWLLKR